MSVGRLVVALWPTQPEFSEAPLLGRRVRERTADAVARMRGARVLRAGALSSERGRSVLHLPAELPCLTPRTLRRLAVAVRRNGWVPSRRRFEETVGWLRTAAVDPTDALWVRSAADLADAARTLRERKRLSLTAAGVFLEDPATVLVDPEVEVRRGARLQAFVVIEGESRVGARAEIGRFTHIVDSAVGEDTVVLDHCFIRSSRIGRRVQIGPFAHLRPESEVQDDAKIGNYVELKKTTVGRGSKVPHLTYLGDSTVGRRVNVGAGTITCNYDGRSKHRTIIEDGAFIGSDVQLVAPVRVGRDAYVAAGSCIVEDVPARSLAIARARQVVKPGWASRARRASRESRANRRVARH